jgi:hypothetical protein
LVPVAELEPAVPEGVAVAAGALELDELPELGELPELDGLPELDDPLELEELPTLDVDPVEETATPVGSWSGVLKLNSRTRAIAVVTRAMAPRRGNIADLRLGIEISIQPGVWTIHLSAT